MAHIDPKLRYLLRHEGADPRDLCASLGLAARPEGIPVLVRCATTADGQLPDAVRGLVKIIAVVDGPEAIVSGIVRPEDLRQLAQAEGVLGMEGAGGLQVELDVSCGEIGARPLHDPPPGLRGKGVLIGFIDNGVDVAHPDFRDDAGNTRILSYWDQQAPAAGGTPGPGGIGRVYTAGELDAMLAAGNLPSPLRGGNGPHGTHIAGIAAGNGRASQGQPPLRPGVAPEAGLVVVATPIGPVDVYIPALMAAGLRFMADCATQAGQPLVINISNGSNQGGHAGDSGLESLIDTLARRPGLVAVKSAGNGRDKSAHASGFVASGATVRRRFLTRANNVERDLLEVWFAAADEIAVALQPPDAPPPSAQDFVRPGTTRSFATDAGNDVEIDAQGGDPQLTGDVQVAVLIVRGAATSIQQGTWTLHLRADGPRDARFDAWFERFPFDSKPHEQATFTDADPSCTITVPGTARRIITVGAYVARGLGAGRLSGSSAQGPTRSGLAKPDLTAPGEPIHAPHPGGGYEKGGGTSLAAPHVAGAAALLLQARPGLTCDQARQLFMRAARRTAAEAAAPELWGAGRLDVKRAVELAQAARFPQVSAVEVDGTRLRWRTDIPCHASVAFDTRPQRVRQARATGRVEGAQGATQHVVDLAGQPPGRYFCEILATAAQEGWWTLDDDEGRQHVVNVP